MVVESISLPGAKPLNVLDIKPTRELESCNHLLGDHDALMRFHDEQGYIFLRDVINHEALDRCREEMFAIMVRHGLIEPGATEPVWTGKPFLGGMEESPEFAGISRRLVEHPANLKVMEQILGEPAAQIPIVQYRTYPPGGSITGPHQDGFYSPGIKNYKPVWMPITNCEREVGGLAVAVGQCNRGFLHNLAEVPSPIPEGVIPADAWATTDYYPGDVLVLNPYAPHASMPNTSNRCRVTIDTRVQSAAHPRVMLADVLEVKPDSIRVRSQDGQDRTFKVDEDTFIRIESPGVRQTIDDYVARTEVGRRIVVIFDGDHAETLRRASEG
jgi:hypothetical protein